MKKELKATESELEILQILWTHGELSVRRVNELQSEIKNVGYTTTLKLLQIMFEKGLCTRQAEGRGHIYSAAIKKQDLQQSLLSKLLDSAFSGSVGSMAMQLLGTGKTSKEELKQIRNLIDKLEEDE